MELVTELDEAMDMARQQKAEIVRLESANVILCEESDNATHKMMAAENRAEEAERLHEICLEETELHKSQIKELTEKLVQSIEDSTHKENSLQKSILTLQNRIKELEEEPQKLKDAMECERTLRLQAEAELIAAKNTASRWKNKCDSSMVKLGVMAERLSKLNNQKKILVKTIEKYRKPAHEKSDGSSNLAAVNDIIDNPEYDKEEAFSDQFKSGPIAIAHDSSNANNENEKQLQNPTDDSQGNQLSTQNVTSTINPQPVRRLSKTNPFAKANEESASGESRERSDPGLNSSNSEKEPSQNSVNAPVPSKAQNIAIRDTRRNTPIFGDEVFVKEATTVNEKSQRDCLAVIRKNEDHYQSRAKSCCEQHLNKVEICLRPLKT